MLFGSSTYSAAVRDFILRMIIYSAAVKFFLHLVIVEYLIGILQYSINNPDLPTSIRDIGPSARAHQGGPIYTLVKQAMVLERVEVPKAYGQVPCIHSVDIGVLLDTIEMLTSRQ